MPFPFDKYPWLNFQELNLAYFIKHFREIFQQWDELYHDLTAWKDATDEELAEWKNTVEVGLSTWKNGVESGLDQWEQETTADLETWKTATLTALNDWQTAFETLFNSTFSDISAIKTDAEAARDAAAASALAAEAAATSVSSSLAQITQNTSDIADLDSRADQIENEIRYFEGYAPTWVNSAYLNYQNGEEGANSSFAYFKAETGGLPVIHVHTWLASLAGVVFYDSNGVFIPDSGVWNPASGTLELNRDLPVPNGAAYIGVSTVIANKNSVSITTPLKSVLDFLAENALFAPEYIASVPDPLTQGIVHKNLTVYNPSASYAGRYLHVTSITPGERLIVSGRSENTNYPCVIWVHSDSTVTIQLSGTGTNYVDRLVVAPDTAVEIYVNGNITQIPTIKRNAAMSKEDVDATILYSVPTNDLHLKALYSSGILAVKKRISDSLSVCVKMAHVGANSLWGFSQICLVDETPGEVMNNNFTSNGTSITASATDWFGPYTVRAVNNADGDGVENTTYFTGGNHRTTNQATGGGITAAETAFSIHFGGSVPVNNQIYNTDEIRINWTNAVQANNTSKADGSGRAVLNENWSVVIDKDGIHCENDFAPTEDVVLAKYYGLQAYFPSASVVYKGGASRQPSPITSATTSGNKTCRIARAYTQDLSIEVEIDPVDLGIYSSDVPYSFFTIASTPPPSKIYPYLIAADLLATANAHFFVRGTYRFW